MSDIEKKINLRAIEPEDIEVLYQWENDKSIWHVSNTITPFSRYVITKYIESAHLDIYQTKQLRLIIEIADDEGSSLTPIGAIDLFDFEPFHLRAGIGILIQKQYQGKGYASQALDILIDYAFNVIQLKQLYCNIGTENTISLALFKKHNFEIIGTKKSWNKTPKGFTDELMLQLINLSF